MAIRRQSERVRKQAVADARWRPEVVVDPLSLRPGPSKAELREQAAEAVRHIVRDGLPGALARLLYYLVGEQRYR